MAATQVPRCAQVPDRELVRAWATGDAAAGDKFVRRYFPLLWRFFRDKAPHDAADLVQRTLLACVRNCAQLTRVEHVRAYVLATARHELYALLRKKGPGFDPLRSSLVAERTSPSKTAARKMRVERLRGELLSLPVALAEAIELHYFEGLSGPELASALGIPEGTVRGRLRRAKQRLADRLGPGLVELLDD